MRYWYQEEDPILATDALIEAYVNGAVSAPLHVLAASGLSLSAQGSTLSQSLDILKGVALDQSETIPLKDHDKNLKKLLDRIGLDDGLSACKPDVESEKPCPDISMPLALQLYVGCELSKMKWKEVSPGFEIATFDKVSNNYASMMRAASGANISFDGTHHWQITLVLAGRFHDEMRHYMRGQVFIAREGHPKQVTVDSDEDCLCYTVWHAHPV